MYMKQDLQFFFYYSSALVYIVSLIVYKRWY